MSEKRRPVVSVLLKNQGKTSRKIEVFDASEWGKSGYRLRLDGCWQDDRKVHCADAGVLTQALSTELARLLGQDVPEPTPKPKIPQGTVVSVPCGHRCPVLGELRDVTRTATDPIRGDDGVWYVAVTIAGQGRKFVPVGELERR